jgi:hypothetical protein
VAGPKNNSVVSGAELVKLGGTAFSFLPQLPLPFPPVSEPLDVGDLAVMGEEELPRADAMAAGDCCI